MFNKNKVRNDKFYIEEIMMKDSLNNPDGTYKFENDFLEKVYDVAIMQVMLERKGEGELSGKDALELGETLRESMGALSSEKGALELYSVV